MDDLGPEGGNVLAFRILPGVDVLEQRWGAARKIFEENPQINVIGVEFVAYDSFKASTVVSDYLAKYGTIDAVWMDAGGTAVTILEAFKDAGAPYPKVMIGEDQQDFLEYWKANDINGLAPTFPTFQWRTAVLAAVNVPPGRDCPAQLGSAPAGCQLLKTWINYVGTGMPPLYYVMSSAEDMTNWPDAWQALDTTKYQDVMP